MSITTLLSNVPNLVKVLSLSAAVGTGGAALALEDARSPMDTTPLVSASAAEPGMGDVTASLPPEVIDTLPSEALLELPSGEVPEMAESAVAESDDADEASERGPGHATGLDRAEERANAHAARGLARARAVHARNAERRGLRAEAGERGGERARAARYQRVERHGERGERGERGAEKRAGHGPF